MAAALRLRGRVGHVVPTTVVGGKRQGGFGFVRCDGVVDGDLDPAAPSPIGVDHFAHVRDIPAVMTIEEAVGKVVAFTPAEHPKGPRAIDVEVLS